MQIQGGAEAGLQMWVCKMRGLSFFFLILTEGHFFIVCKERRREKRGKEREKERGRRRETEREKNIDELPSHTRPDREMNPQPEYVLWLGIEPVTLLCAGWLLNHWVTQARAILVLLFINYCIIFHTKICEPPFVPPCI